MRFNNHENYYEETNMQAGLGYRPNQKISYWLGYTWGSHTPQSNGERVNGLWEQLVWEFYKNNWITMRTRTRFDQNREMHEPEWANVFRNKLSFYFPNKLCTQCTPLVYDEIFVKLNDPEWTAGERTVKENRLFVGIDVPMGKKAFWEIGYLQRANFNVTENELDHILYIGLNINPQGRPVPQYVR